MLRPASISTFLVALTILFAGCGAPVPEALPAIAHVDGEAIAADEFRTRYAEYLLSTGLPDEPQHRTRLLETLVAERLLVREARAGGVEERPAFLAAAERIHEKLSIEIYVQRVLFDTLQVTEAEAQDFFARASTTVNARHLYARTRPEAERLRARLLAGATFEDLAREVFADSALAHSGGAVGPFSLDEMDPAFEEAAYTLAIGEISEPVRTESGYSIIRVDDRFTKPLLTEYEYATRRDRMMHYATYRQKTAARTQHARDLAASLNASFDEPALERLLAQITGASVAPGSDEAGWLQDPLVSFDAGGDRQTWTVATFRDAAAGASDAQRAAVTDRASLIEFVEGLLVREAMLRAARDQGLDREPAFKQAYEAAVRDWIREEAVRDLRRQASVPEDSIQAYFARFGAEFMTPARVRVSEILLDSKSEADRLRPLATPATFATLAREHSIRPGAKATGGDLGWVNTDQLGVLANPVLAAPAGTLLGPIELQGHYVLLLVGERVDGRPMNLPEARPLIEERLRGELLDRRLRERIVALRRDSEVTIDQALLTQLDIKKTHV